MHRALLLESFALRIAVCLLAHEKQDAGTRNSANIIMIIKRQ